MNIFEDAHDPDHRRRINSLAQSFVVEAYVAASDWHIKFFASFGDAIDRLRKLPHDVRLFGIAKVQAIRRADGRRARTCNIARSFRNRMHRAQLRIEITPAPVAIERHRQSALRALDTNHSRIARTRALDRVGLHHVIVLLPHPALAANVRTAAEVCLRFAVKIGSFA